MPNYEGKYVDADGVEYLWNKARKMYVKQEAGKGLSQNNYTNEEKTKLAGLENYELPAATKNSLGGVKIGDGLSVDANGVIRTVYNPEMAVEWDTISDVPTTIEGYGITDAASKDDLDEIRTVMQTAIAGVYKYKGQVATVAALEEIQNPKNGDVYDVLEDGSNYGWNATESRWDNFGSVLQIDSLSNYELDLITGSASSETALKALLAEGGTVDLNANITLSEPVTLTSNTVLDLNGNTLTYSEASYALIADNATLTIKNGTIRSARRIAQAANGGEVIVDSGTFVSGDVAFAAMADSKVTINGGTSTAQEGCIGAFDGGEIEINNGTVKSLDNPVIFTNKAANRGNNVITINGGLIEASVSSQGYQSCGVFVANNDTVVMNGGRIVSTDGCGLLMRAGSVTINDGEIVAEKNTYSPGYVVDDSRAMSASAVIFHETANYPGSTVMSLTINDGRFVGTDNSLEIISNAATPSVQILGGEFNPELEP